VFHPYKHQRLAELGMDLNLARRSSSKLTKTGIRPIRPDGIIGIRAGFAGLTRVPITYCAVVGSTAPLMGRWGSR